MTSAPCRSTLCKVGDIGQKPYSVTYKLFRRFLAICFKCFHVILNPQYKVSIITFIQQCFIDSCYSRRYFIFVKESSASVAIICISKIGFGNVHHKPELLYKFIMNFLFFIFTTFYLFKRTLNILLSIPQQTDKIELGCKIVLQ